MCPMFLLTVYNLVFAAGLALLTPLHLLRLCFRSKHRRSTLPRLGWQKLPTPAPGDKVVWIHSCSVGETQVSRTLCRELRKRDPELKIYLSTITETGQEVAAQILKDGLCDGHFYFPVDVAPIMSRILDQLRPSAFVVVETDLWYCCMELCRRRNIPCILVNGKISERSLERYLKLPFFAKALLRPFRQLLVQSSTYRDRFYPPVSSMARSKSLATLSSTWKWSIPHPKISTPSPPSSASTALGRWSSSAAPTPVKKSWPWRPIASCSINIPACKP